jgi:hypothetical protein
VEHVPQKSAAQSNGTIVRKLLPMERQRQVHSQDRILREGSNIAEHTEHTRNVAGTLMDTRRCEDKAHVGLSTENENTEASSVHKNRTSGVVINSSIIPMQVTSVRGFTVGSIMLEDVSLASVNQEEKTGVNKVHGKINGCESPQQTEQSGKDNYGVQLAKDAQRNDSVKRSPVKEPSTKKQSDVGRLNCVAIPAPSQLSGGTDNYGLQHAKDAQRNDSVKRTAFKEPSKKKQSDIGRLNCAAIPAPSQLSGGTDDYCYSLQRMPRVITVSSAPLSKSQAR